MKTNQKLSELKYFRGVTIEFTWPPPPLPRCSVVFYCSPYWRAIFQFFYGSPFIFCWRRLLPPITMWTSPKNPLNPYLPTPHPPSPRYINDDRSLTFRLGKSEGGTPCVWRTCSDLVNHLASFLVNITVMPACEIRETIISWGTLITKLVWSISHFRKGTMVHEVHEQSYEQLQFHFEESDSLRDNEIRHKETLS